MTLDEVENLMEQTAQLKRDGVVTEEYANAVFQLIREAMRTHD